MLIACVTDQESCERQIKAGADLAKKFSTTLRVVSVMPVSAGTLGKGLGSPELEHLYEISRQYHAEMNVYFNGDPVAAISELIENASEPVEALICGSPGRRHSNDFIDRLRALLPDLNIYIMSSSGIMLPLALETLSLG